MQNKTHTQITKLITLALLAAIAYIVMFFFRIPMIVPFLKFDPKDIVIVIAGFLYGPLSSFAVSVVVSLVEMFTVSDTGPIGLVMNILASCAFACTAAYVYKRKKSIKSAVVGLVLGVLAMTGIMLLWNYLITPMYLNTSREEVVGMLIPMFLPFNLIKGGINAVVSILLYKPLSVALRKARLVPKSSAAPQDDSKTGFKLNLGLVLVCLVVLASIVFLAYVLTTGV